MIKKIGYNAKCSLNGKPIIDWQEIIFSNTYGNAETTFNVKTATPIDGKVGDNFKFSDSFGTIINGSIEQFGLENETAISGNSIFGKAGSSISRLAAPVDTYYINDRWLRMVCPGYKVVDGIVYYDSALQQSRGSSPNTSGLDYSDEDDVGHRFMGGGMPGPDVKNYEFVCHIQADITYHDIARKIASFLGYNIVINTPNLAVQKMWVHSAQQTYWEALTSLFSLWRPVILIDSKGEGDQFKKIIVMNVRQQPSSKSINISEKQFEVLNVTHQKNPDNRVIDHVCICGSTVKPGGQIKSKTFSRQKLAAKPLLGLTFTDTFESAHEYPEGDQLDRTLWSTSSESRPVKTVTTIESIVDPKDYNNIVTKKQTIDDYNSKDEKINSHVVEYEYASFQQVASSKTTEYGRIGVVGGGVKEKIESSPDDKKPADFFSTSEIYQQIPIKYEWEKLKEETITYFDYIDQAGACETDTIEMSLCCVYIDKFTLEDSKTDENKEYVGYDQCRPITSALKSGMFLFEEAEEDEDGKKLGWTTVWKLTKKESVRYYEANQYFLRRTRTTTTMLPSPVTKTVTEDIPVHWEKNKAQKVKKWNYLNNQGNVILMDRNTSFLKSQYHPKITIKCDDIVNEETARNIAICNFSYIPGNPKNHITSIKISTVIPIPGLTVGSKMKLPSFSKKYFNTSKKVWETVNFSDPVEYWVVSVTQKITTSPKGETKAVTELELRDRY